MSRMGVNQWRAIAASLGEGDVIEVEYEPTHDDGRTVVMEMRLGSEWRGWWRGIGTDGRNMWKYTTLWLGDQIYAGNPAVLLKYEKNNGQYGGVYGRVVDVRLIEQDVSFGGISL